MHRHLASAIRHATLPFLLMLVVACSSSQAPEKTGAEPGAAIASPPAQGTACAMIDAAQMSEIFGEKLTAEPHDERLASLQHSECYYFGKDHSHFSVMLSIQRSNVKAYANGLQIPPHGPATESNPYADLGDGAKGIGPLVYIVHANILIGIDSQAVFVDNHDIANRHRIVEQVLHVLGPKLAAAAP